MSVGAVVFGLGVHRPGYWRGVAPAELRAIAAARVVTRPP